MYYKPGVIIVDMTCTVHMAIDLILRSININGFKSFWTKMEEIRKNYERSVATRLYNVSLAERPWVRFSFSVCFYRKTFLKTFRDEQIWEIFFILSDYSGRNNSLMVRARLKPLHSTFRTKTDFFFASLTHEHLEGECGLNPLSGPRISANLSRNAIVVEERRRGCEFNRIYPSAIWRKISKQFCLNIFAVVTFTCIFLQRLLPHKDWGPVLRWKIWWGNLA